MARNGERGAAVEMGGRALRLVDANSTTAKRWPEDSRTALSALGVAAAGHVSAALAKSEQRQPSDRDEARRLQDGLRFYRGLEGRPAFTANVQREMRAVERELENLK